MVENEEEKLRKMTKTETCAKKKEEKSFPVE